MKFAPLFLLLASCSAYPGRSPGREDKSISGQTGRTDRPPQVHVHVEVPVGSLAAYQLVLRWDPAVARIRAITPCSSRPFPGSPEFDAESFSSGTVRVFGTAQRCHTASGETHLLTVTFERVATGRTRVDVQIEALYDDAPSPRRIAGILTVEPREIRFD